jgi:IclR family transcriptional regulator, mhp operon transcriptional activator
MPSYEPVTALIRGLAVLDAMAGQAASTIRGLHAATGIPKPTLVRILETLSFAGYVEAEAGGYRLTRRQPVAASRPPNRPAPKAGTIAALLANFEENSGWPAVFAKPGAGGMRSASSRFAMPFLTSAAGRAYLSRCDEAERTRWLATSPELADSARRQTFSDQLAVIRSRGYARGQTEIDPTLIALAAPVSHAGTVVGAVVLMAARDAISMAELEHGHASDLRKLAEALGATV